MIQMMNLKHTPNHIHISLSLQDRCFQDCHPTGQTELTKRSKLSNLFSMTVPPQLFLLLYLLKDLEAAIRVPSSPLLLIKSPFPLIIQRLFPPFLFNAVYVSCILGKDLCKNGQPSTQIMLCGRKKSVC